MPGKAQLVFSQFLLVSLHMFPSLNHFKRKETETYVRKLIKSAKQNLPETSWHLFVEIFFCSMLKNLLMSLEFSQHNLGFRKNNCAELC